MYLVLICSFFSLKLLKICQYKMDKIVDVVRVKFLHFVKRFMNKPTYNIYLFIYKKSIIIRVTNLSE